ncbi:MAG: hypothetical protein HYZ53_12115 [Planctomycetes bacterium]|nr:hypothetical protein [Planctomycetota bacterium]
MVQTLRGCRPCAPPPIRPAPPVVRAARHLLALCALLTPCLALASCAEPPRKPPPVTWRTSTPPPLQGIFSDQLEGPPSAAALAAQPGGAASRGGAVVGEFSDALEQPASAPPSASAPASTRPEGRGAGGASAGGALADPLDIAPGGGLNEPPVPHFPAAGTRPSEGIDRPRNPLPDEGSAIGPESQAIVPIPGPTDSKTGLTAELLAAEERHKRSPSNVEATKRLIVLYLLAGREEDALRLLVGGLRLRHDELLQLVKEIVHDQVGDEAEALRILELHWNNLRRDLPLTLTTASFCTAVEGFGRYVPERRREFRAGQQVAVYCELDNFECRRLASDRFQVSVHADFEVLLPGPEERTVPLPGPERYLRDQDWLTERPLHDLWFGLRLQLPANLIPGPYLLRVVVHDMQAEKKAEARLPFRIVNR